MPYTSNTPAGGSGSGTVTSVTATDTSIVVGGTATAPTIATGTLDVIAADHPAAADWSNNGHAITSVSDLAISGLTGATAASRYVGATASGAPASGTFAVGDFVIDQLGRVWICVTAGTPGTWTNATKSRTELGWTAEGIIVENWAPAVSQSNSAPSTQVVYGWLLGLHAGDVVTGVVLRNSVAAAGTSPTTARFGIADSTGKILARSNNLAGAANWPANAVRFPLSAAYTVLADGGFYACFVVNGTWGTTQPTPYLGFASAANNTAVGSGAPAGFQWSGQTDLPTVGSSVTLTTGSGLPYYMAFY